MAIKRSPGREGWPVSPVADHACTTSAVVDRVPLTDEQIDAALDAARVGELPDGWTSIERDIARAIEAAHGITAAKDKP